MQQQPQVIYGPNGQTARLVNGQYVVDAAPAAAPARPATMPTVSGPPGLVPMETPQLRAQTEERQYDRGRDAVRDQLTDAREARAIAAAERQAEAQRIANEKLTEDQGKAGGYAQLMADAERSYQQALSEGFNPTGFRAGLANFTDNIPLMGGVGNFIRDDAGDRARQAELQWSDAQLKAMSGAASPEPEVVRNQITNFARPGQNYGYIGERLEDARRTAFESARRRAGRDLQGLAYPNTDAGELPIRDLLPGETPEALAASGRIRGADGVWRYPRDEQGNPIIPEGNGGGSPPAGPAGGGNNGGLLPVEQRGRGNGYETALAQERANADIVARAPAGGYDMGMAFTAPLNDELAYAEGFLRQGVGNIGRRLTGQDIEVSAADRGRASQDVMLQDQDRFAREHPFQNFSAQALAGATLGPAGSGRAVAAPVVTRTLGQRALALGGRMAQGGSVGGAYGFAEADGTVAERAPQAALTAAVSALAVPAVEKIIAPGVNALANNPATRFMGRQIGALGERIGVPGAAGLSRVSQENALQSGMNLFADRMGAERVNALSPRIAEQRGLGMDQATLVDALDDGAVGRMRALNTRDTPARDGAVRFAEDRRRNLPSRSARIAVQEISPDTRPTLEVMDGLRATRRANADAMQGFGDDPVPMGQDAILALRSDLVRPALRDAALRAQASLDPAEREAASRLMRLADTALDDPSSVSLTVREIQDVSKALNDAASGAYGGANTANGPVYQRLADALRETGRNNSSGYRQWLTNYADDSGMIEAATTGRNLVSVSRDPTNARGTSAFVARAENASAPELTVQRAAGREAWEAASSNPSGARTTLEAAASDVDQSRRLAAIGADSGRIAARSQAELDAVTAAQRASPRVGSESVTNATDAADTFGAIVQAAGRPIQAAGQWAVNRLTSRGFSNAEAQAIGEAAIDPARTDELIGMLSQRMSRREARNLSRALRFQLTTGLQSVPQN